jgi:hypothetical protein
MTVARFFLGLAIMPYAIDKILCYQFKVPAWSYAQPLGMTNGSTLAWAMLGYSPRLQMLLGFFELIPALMLLNVRTRRLGALFMFPVLLSAVLINFSLDLWPTTKIVSLTLLVVNSFLILYEGATYLDLLKHLVVSPTLIASEKFHLTAKVASASISIVGMAISAFAIVFSIVHFQVPVSDFTGMPQINGSGAWKISSVTIAGRPIAFDPDASFFFHTFNNCVYGTVAHPTACLFEADKSRHTFEIKQVLLQGSSSAIKGT